MNEELNYGYGAQGIDPITGLPIEGTGPINPNFTSGGKKETKTVDPYAGQVDPATGLPLTDYQKRNPNSIVAPGDAPSFSTKSYYQVDLDAYSDYMDQVKPWVGQTEMDRRRAVGQSGWEQAGKAVVRTVGGAILDFTGGMASMLDIEDYYNQDDEIGNPITNKMDELKQQLNDALPIYRENPNEAFDFGDPGWWYENGSSLVSSIAAFAGQGMVVGATLGAGAAGLAANLGAKAGKILQGGAKVLTAAGLNQTEAVMEAGAVYRDNMQHYMKMGASEEAAKAKAANDAATVININRANIALNLTSASMFTRMGAQSALTRELRKAPVKLFSKEGLKTVGLEGIQEFAEEQINYIGSEEGKKAITGSNNKSLLEALMDGKSMSKYADDPHFWESGVLGAVGGIGQGGAGFAYRKASGKYKQDLDAFTKQEQRIAELDAMASKTDAKTGTISEVFLKAEALKPIYEKQKEAEKEYENAVKEGDPQKVKEALKKIQETSEQALWKHTTMALQDGTTGHLINGFKGFENLSEDEARKKGLPEDYKERAQDAIKFIEQAEAAYNEMEFRPVSTKMDAVVNRANAHRLRNAIKETKEEIDNTNKAISDLRSGLSANDAALSDEALADKNSLFAELLKEKRKKEALSDYYSERLNNVDSEYSTLLKDNIGKRAAKKLSKVEELELRKQDAFRERLQDDILDGKITRPVLESLKDDVRRSNHPQKEKRLEILNELIDNIKERENNAFKQKAKEAQLEILKDVNNQANNLRDTLGLSKKQAEKVAEVASKKAENNEKKEEIQATDEALLNADQQSLAQIFSSTEMDPQTGLPLTEEDAEVKEKTKQIKDNAPNKTYESLSEERKSELSPEIDFALTAAKSTEEFNQAMEIIAGEEVEPADLALLEKRKEELEQYEAEALKQLKEQEEFRKQALDAGIDPDVMLDAATLTLTELASDEADNAAKDGLDYEPAAGFDNTSEIDAIEGMEEEAKNKRKSKMDAVPKDAVATVDTQFASVVIVEPKTSSLADIEAGVKEKGFYASATDANGNRLRKPATPYAIKPFRSLTKAEQEKAIPLFWYPIRVDDKTGLPLFKEGRGMDKYLYNKSGAPVPLNENAMVGEQLYMVPQGDEIIYEDEIISFAEWTKPDNAKVDSVVYLKKGQYVYPRGEKKGQDIKPGTDHTNEVITIHLTPDGPPVQRLSEGDTDLRRNFETYADKSGAVPVRVAEKNRGMVINQKGPDGQSVKNPISVLGKVNEDYFLGVGRQGNVHYYDGNNWIDAEAQVEEGRVYAMIKSANGELIPIRLETKNISEQDANALIDNVLLNPGISGQVKAQIIADVVSTIRNHNIANAENPRGPLFYVDPIAVKLRVGDMIIAIDHVTTGNYNNLEQALKGETFQARVFETSVSSPNYSYGALRKDKEGKPQRAYFNSKSDASLSKATQEALKDFRATLVKAMTEKTYNVNRNGIAENDMHTDYTQGENGKDYDSYTEYLADKGILTTDVIGLGTGQRFTNSKGHVLPVNKKITLIAPSSTTTQQTKTTTTTSNQQATTTTTTTKKQTQKPVIDNTQEKLKEIESKKEEALKKLDKRAEDLKQVKPSKVEPDLNFEGETMYLKSPVTNGDFLDEHMSSKREFAGSMFKVVLDKNNPNRATIEFDPDAKVLNFVIQNPDKNIEKVSDYLNNLDRDYNGKVVNVRKGIIEKKGDRWVVVQRPKIAFGSPSDSISTFENLLGGGVNASVENELNQITKEREKVISEYETAKEALKQQAKNIQDIANEEQVIEVVSETDEVITGDLTENEVDNLTVEPVPGVGEGVEIKPEDMPDEDELDKLFRIAEEQFEKDPTSILTETELNWILNTFGEEHLVPMAQAKKILIQGQEAYGAYSKGLIHLARLGAKGTAYHEAFHLVMDLAMTPNEKQAILIAAQAKYGTFLDGSEEHNRLKKLYPKKTRTELEEVWLEENLAEDFRKFMEAEESDGKIKKTKLSRIIQKIFDRIRQAILVMRIAGTKILNPDSIYLSSMIMKKNFLSIKMGDMKVDDRTKASLKKTQFNTTEARLRSKKGFSEDEKQDALNVLRYGLLQKVIPNILSNPELNTTGAKNISDFLTKNEHKKALIEAIDQVRKELQNTSDTMQKNYDKSKKTVWAQAKYYVDKIISEDGWEDVIEGGVVKNPGFKSLLLDALKLHGAQIRKIKAKESSTDNTFEKQENENLEFGEAPLDEDGDEEGNTSAERVHDQHFALSDPKKTLSFEVKTALSFIPAPTIVDQKTGETISTGRSKYTMLPTFIDFHKVYSTLAGKLASVPTEKIESKLEEIAEWNPEVKAVFDAYKEWSPELKNTFKSVMSKTQLKFMTVVAGENEKWELIETNREGIQKQIIAEWALNKNNKNLFEETQGEVASVNQKVLQQFGDAYNTLKKIAEGKKPVDYYNAVNEVFSYVGIEFDAPTLNMFASKYPIDAFQKNIVEGKFEYILKDLGYNPKTGKITNTKGADPYVSTESKGQLKTISKIADLVKDLRTDLYTGSFVNGEGKMVYSINLNSYITKFGAKTTTKEGIEELWKEFSQDVYYNPDGNMEIYSSIFLSLLKNNENVRNEFDIIELDTTKDTRKTDGTGFTSMREKQSWLTRLAMFSNNGNKNTNGYAYISMGTKSDKGRSLYMKVPVLQNAKSPNELRRGNRKGIDGVKAAAIHVLRRTVMQEYARIKKVEEQLFGENALRDDQLIENYHYKGTNDDGTLNRQAANGLKFLSIPDLNFDNHKMFDSNGRVVKLSGEAVLKRVEKALENFLDREILRGKKRMEGAGVLFEKDGKYYTDIIDGKSFDGVQTKIDGELVLDVDDSIAEFLMNEVVWRTEMNKFQMGDLAFYKTQATDISNNAEFEGNKGKFLSVVTDAGKRGYQSITPGIDHVIDSVYGKPKTMTMAVIGDIFSEMSLKEAGNMVYNLLKDKSFKYKPYLTDINKSLDGLTADQKDAIKITRAYLKGSNVADGQGYTTLESHRHSMMSRGDWTMGEGETHETAYNEYWTKEKDYNKWPDWAKNLALKPLKTFSFGYQYDLATQSMVFKQIKHSTTPLYPAMTKAVPALDKLRQRMEATGEYAGMQKIDVVNMDSAVKVGKSGVNTYTKDGSYLNNLTTQVIYAENERNPFILPTDKGTDPKDGSQFAKLVTGNMPSEAVYTTIKGIDSMTTEEIKSVNDAVYAEKLKRSYDKLMKDLQYDEYMKNPTSRETQLNYLKNVQRLLLEQIESRELPDNYSLALEIQELENGQYTFAMPLSFPAYAKKFEIALASLFKSRVLTQRLEGDQAVQVAEYGIEENNLKYYEFEDGKMKAAECAISYKQAEKLGLTKYANENGEIDYKAMEKDGIDRSVLEIIGYRIPTQGKSSMLPLIVKRILPPTAKGQIMLPHAITTQTGADYDVDKLFLYFPKLKKTKDGRVVRAAVGKSLKGLVDGTKDVSSLSDAEIQNILFNIRFGILTSEHNSKEVVNPLDSDTYKNKLKEYDKYGLLEKTGTFNFASGYTDMHLEMVNKDAKMLIGIFSLHSVAQSLSQDTNIETSSPVYIKTKDANGNEIGTKNNPANDLQGQVGFDGILKSIYINENQNAALDNAKEPVTGSLNITLFTSNVISYLNRLGYNNDIAVDFVNQPIIRELSKENDLSDDFWVASLADTVSSRFGLPTKGRDGKELKYSSSEQNRVEITPENLKKQLGKNLAEMKAEELMYQKQVLVDFVQYHKAGADLAKANKAMSPDRFTQMSGLVDIEIWKDNKKYVESNSSEIQVPDLYSENTTLKRVKAYYDYGILGAEEQISNFMPYNSLMFDQTKKDIAFITHQKAGTITDKDLLNTINGDILAYILLGKNSPISLLFADNYKEVMKKRLFDKNASIAKDVEVIKKKYNLKNNIFLKMLQADTFNSRNSLQMLKFNNAASYSGETKSSFTDAFEELIDRTEKVVKVKRDKSGKYVEMNSEEKVKAVQEVRTVMQRVVQYGILTSGFQSGPNSFIDLFPISLWKNLFLDTEGQSVASLSEYMLNIKDTFNDLLSDNDSKYKTVEEHLLNPELGISGHSNLVDQIVRNRFTTPKLVKSVSVVGNKLDVLQEAKAKVAFPGRFRINADNAGNVFTRQTKTTPFSGFPSYLKMWDKGNKKWRLYALQEHKTGPTYGFAEYQVISPLGENNKFFEVYPSEMNPVSIHPDNNDFEMVEKKKAKKESVDIQPDQPGLADIIKTATKADNTTDIEAELNAATPISFITLEDTADGSSDIDFSNMVDLGDISFGSTEMDEVYKKKNEEGDVDGICGI